MHYDNLRVKTAMHLELLKTRAGYTIRLKYTDGTEDTLPFTTEEEANKEYEAIVEFIRTGER